MIGILTTTHIRSAAALGSLRLLVDSIRAIPREDYGPFLIVDDCSPEMAAPYYNLLEKENFVRIVRLGEPRTPHWGPKHGMLPPAGESVSFGHALGLMAGFWKLRQLGCTKAWVVDSDCVILDPSCLRDSVKVHEATGAAVTTDYFCGRPDPHLQAVDNLFHYKMDPSGRVISSADKSKHPGHAAWALYGFPVLFCALVDLLKEPKFGVLHNAGWVNSKWGYRLFRQGEKVAYFPFFQGEKVFHLGLGFTSTNINPTQTFGNATETRIYGGKERGYHHAGYLQLKRSHESHAAWLAAVGEAPAGQRFDFDRSWLISPGRTRLPPYEDLFIRPIYQEDFTALQEIDRDADTTRFLSWGPHVPEQTRAFLDRVLASRSALYLDGSNERWWALSDQQGQLLGFGETRHLPEVGPHAYGLVYIIAPRHRRKGHGEFLLNQLIMSVSAQLDADTCVVAIDTRNIASIATLAKRSDFATDWKRREEPYVLKGQPASRYVYTRHFPIIPEPPPSTLDECIAAQERFLFEGCKMLPI